MNNPVESVLGTSWHYWSGVLKCPVPCWTVEVPTRWTQFYRQQHDNLCTDTWNLKLIDGGGRMFLINYIIILLSSQYYYFVMQTHPYN